MATPSHASFPLALNLQCEHLYDVRSKTRRQPGERLVTFSLERFDFLNSNVKREQATFTFGRIIQCLYNHSDWSQLYSFFTRRYTKRDFLSSRSERKFNSGMVGDPSFHSGSRGDTTVNFNTDPTSVGLPKDLINQIDKATKDAIGSFLGADPINCSIGPAISMGMGTSSYMDLIYGGQPPNSDLPETTPENLATSRRGGHGRTAVEWKTLWAAIGDWVYEHESTGILLYGGISSSKPGTTAADLNPYHGMKYPRQFLQTHAIRGADAIRDVFGQIAQDRKRFHGIEWDFLDLAAPPSIRDLFLTKFGPRPVDRSELANEMSRKVVGLQTSPPNEQVMANSSRSIKCPQTSDGNDWAQWMLSVQGGCVISVDTVFQALWAVIWLAHAPLNIEIKDQSSFSSTVPAPDCVYL